jgi:Tfp pilus assembly protein PilP
MRLRIIGGWAMAGMLGLSLLCACSEKKGPEGAGAKGPGVEKAAAKPEPEKTESNQQLPEESKVQVWSYDPTGKRDIFEVPPAPKPRCETNPGTCYDLSQLWVDAVIIGSGMDVAHVILPGGKDIYVRVGDELGLNHGRIKQIRDKEVVEKLPSGTERKTVIPEVVIEEIYVDPSTQNIHVIEKILQMKK